MNNMRAEMNSQSRVYDMLSMSSRYVAVQTEIALSHYHPQEEIEQPGGFLTEADTIVQPFHLPRFGHDAYEAPAYNGTAAERDEDHDKFTRNDSVNLATKNPTEPRSNLSAYPSEDGEDDDLEEVFPVTDSKIITSAEVQAPRSMLDFAKENEAQQSGISSGDHAVEEMAYIRGAHEPPQNQHSNKLTSKRSAAAQKRGSNSSIPKRRQIKNNPRRSVRKGDQNIRSSSSSELSDPDDELGNGDQNGEPGYSDARKSGLPSNLSRSIKRDRVMGNSSIPTSTRVLRKRVPKTAEQIRAEQDVEAAYRESIAG